MPHKDSTKRKAYMKKYMELPQNKEKRSRYGKEYYQKTKEAQKAKRKEYVKRPEVAAKRRERCYARKLVRDYGITPQRYQEMLAEQDHKCKACGKNLAVISRQLIHVDHCHTTGKVRGILCHHCNCALGNVGDSIDKLLSLIEYLKKCNGAIG